MFRDPSGQLGFYYQMILNQNSAAIQEFLIFNDLSTFSPFSFNGSNVGMRTDGLGTFGSISFVPSAHEPTHIALFSRQVPPVLFPNIDLPFTDSPIQASQATATLAVLLNAPDYNRNGGLEFFTVPQADGVSYGFLTTGSVLVPTQIPEPATWVLVGLSVIAAGSIAKFQHYRLRQVAGAYRG
ncbi:MAG: hypothetical protein JO033_15090 [Acidobacteriaceae bacterium]|nr:hypothetical protein [Acidobacteriaceae bacterium]